MRKRRRCAVSYCRHAPNAHVDPTEGGCRLCGCTGWLDRKRNVWQDQVTDAWRTATQAWLLHREEVAIGYATEEAEFEAHHPRPRLADFMHALMPGVPPEVLEDLKVPCRCCASVGQREAS